MKRKMHKILLLTSIVTAGILFLCSCSQKTPDEKLTDSFLEYSLGKTDGKFNRVFTTSNGTEMVISALTKEDAHYPKVLLSVEIGNTDFKNQIYQWITSPVSVRMDDYRECAEMVIKYAKNENSRPVFSPKSFLICVYPNIIINAIGIIENILYAIIEPPVIRYTIRNIQ